MKERLAGPQYARTTITVPRPLKRRMKRQGQLVNWSAVATAAFRAKLDEIEERNDCTSMDAVVERLRHTRGRDFVETSDARAGEEAGRRWAMRKATFGQLQRLASFRQSMTDEEWQALFSSDRGLRRLVRQLTPEVRGPKRAWKLLLADEPDRSGKFYAAFTAGALAVWEQVKDRL